MKVLSLIVPCYNEEQSLPYFYDEIMRIAGILNEVEFEILLVDDGSKDGTLDAMRSLHEKDQRVKYLSFSRNFGKEAAMYAGLQNVTGDYVAVIDADLQHPPEMLIDMYHGIVDEHYDSVAARRVSREGEPKIRSFFARSFYRILNKLSKVEIVDGSVDYRLMTRQMVDAVLTMSEKNRFTKGIFAWVGFKTKWLEFKNVERVAGETKWSFWKLFLYSLEGIIGFSTAPLAFASFLGLFFCVVSFLAIVYIVIKTIIWGDPTNGWPSLACIIFMVSGIQLFCMGILGQYLGKMYIETKNRPVYLVREAQTRERSIDPDGIAVRKQKAAGEQTGQS